MNKQNQVIGALFTSLIVTGSFCTPVFSQVEEDINGEDSNSTTQISQDEAIGNASDLLIPARGSINHDTLGDVHEGVTQFRGFFPLFQTPGSDLLYFNGGFNLDNSGNFGASAIVGYRKYLEEMNRIFGGYFGWDNRETDKSTFDQIVIGVESLGDWDFRLNGFIPVGETRNQILNYDTGLTVDNIRFQDHYLMFDTNQEIRKIFESAVTGFDLEVGTKLADLGETGSLRGYAGPYYYSADGGEDSLGFRLRLTANPTDYITLGLGFQTDGIFGENLLFTVGTNFPGTRAKPLQNDQDSVLARLGDNVFRNSTILVDRQEERETIATADNKATNPETDQPWFFNHVNLGLGNSNGTWEDPYGTLAEGIEGNGEGPAIPTDGNGIVYIRGVGDITRFPTIPNHVRVLSAGPIQIIPVGNMPGYTEYRLPESGTAVANGVVDYLSLPRVLVPIVIENGTTSVTKLSGFNIDLASYYENNEVDETNNGAGIIVNDMIGDVRIEYNRIAGVPQTGIDVNLTTPGTGNLSIQSNELNVAGIAGAEGVSPTGVDINIADGAGMGNLEILDNTINVTGADGQDPTVLYGVNISSVEGATSGTVGKIDILNNEIAVLDVNEAPAGEGVAFNLQGATTGDITIDNNTIDPIIGVSLEATNSTTGSVTITNNEIVATQSGIEVGLDNSTINGDLTIGANQIDVTGVAGAEGVSPTGVDINIADGAGMGNLEILDNTINVTGAEDQNPSALYGININSAEGATSGTIGNIDILNNQITVLGAEGGETFSAGEGIVIGLEGATTGDITIDGNTIDPYIGISLQASDSTTGAVTITNNDIAAYSYGIGVGLYNSEIGGDLTISGNTITAPEGTTEDFFFGELGGTFLGIIAQGEGSTINGNVNMENNTVDAGLAGIAFGGAVFGSPSVDLTVTGDVNINNNTINVSNYSYYTNSYGGGIIIGAEGSSFNNINLNNNNITVDVESSDDDADAGGILIQTSDTTIADLTISGNTLNLTSQAYAEDSNADAYGIYVDVYDGGTMGDVTISGNTLDVTGDDYVYGIDVKGEDGATFGNNVTISGNTLNITGDDYVYGIDFSVHDATFGDVVISSNTIDLATAEGGTGIWFTTAEGTTMTQFRITENLLRDISTFTNDTDGIYTRLGTAITGTITNNTITDFSDDSIDVDAICTNVTVTGNTSINPGDEDVENACPP